MDEHDEPADEQQLPAKADRPRWFLPALIGAGVLVIAVAAVSIVGAVNALSPHTFTAKGGVVISGSTCDSISAGYDDITKGAGVTIKDPSGKAVAIGELGAGKDIGDSNCAFLFTVKDVPAGLGIYGVEVTHRGVVQYKEAALKKDGAVMGLGG